MHGDPLNDYIQFMRYRHLSRGLIARRASLLRAAERRIGRNLLRATPDDITAFLGAIRDTGVADSTLYVYAGHLRAFYGWALQQGRARRNPVVGAAVPRRPRYLPRPIPDDRLAVALGTAEPRVRIVLALAAFAGLRAVNGVASPTVNCPSGSVYGVRDTFVCTVSDGSTSAQVLVTVENSRGYVTWEMLGG